LIPCDQLTAQNGRLDLIYQSREAK
jgi:hypothetical protein